MENQLVKKSGTIAAIVTFALLGAWFGFSKFSLGAYNEKNLTKQFLAEDSAVFKTIVIEVGSDTVARIIAGTTSMTLTGTSSYQYQPRIQYDNTTGLWTFKNSGGTATTAFGTVTAGYVTEQIGSNAANYVLKNNGSSTDQLATNPTLAGQGTITASFNVSGLVITPAELSMVDGAAISLNKATGSITSHTHNGSDGTTQIPHNNITGTGTNSHLTIDTFIASKAQASGLASLDANSLAVQNPASGTSTPGVSKIPISLGTGFLNDSWLSNNVTKLGTPTTDNISEGSTNKYYTNARANAAFGSSSIHSLSDVADAISEGDFLKKVGGNIVGGSNTVTVSFPDVTGSATASQLPLISGLSGSATASQLPTVIRLTGTTTEQIAGAYGQLYVQSTTTVATTGTATGFGTLTTASLVSYYRLTGLGDNFGGNNLTNNGSTSVTFVAGKYGNCATFDGTSQYLQASVLSTNTTNISMFAWVYVPTSSESRGFLNNGIDGQDINGYALTVGSNSVASSGNNLIGHLHAADTIVFGLIGTGWHHVGMTRGTSTWKGYIDAVLSGTTSTTNPVAPSGNFTIGRNNASAVNKYWNDKIDDVVFYNKELSAGEVAELYNNTGGFFNYTQYSAKYKDPTNGRTVFEISTQGTATAQPSYVFLNGSTTVIGAGTATGVLGTSTTYAGWCVGAFGAEALNLTSTEKIKTNIEDIEISPNLLDAEAEAKLKYIADKKVAWIAINQNNYKSVVNEIGTGSVTKLDTQAMESDYANYIELEWASDLNQDTLITAIQVKHENEFWQNFDTMRARSWNPINELNLTRRGFVVEEVPDDVKGGSKQTIDPMAIIAKQQKVLQYLKAESGNATAEIGSLTAALENQKIAYNEEVDNLYKLINAVIVALLAIGGVSGWNTIRRKRKGT